MRDTTVQAATPADEARKKTAFYLTMVLGWIALDQVTKVVVQRSLRLYDPVEVMGDVFRLTFIYNPGAAFGLHLGVWSRIAFSVLSLVATAVLLAMYRGTAWGDKARLVAITLVTGGALGNLIDRIRSSRGVIDFLDFGIGTHRWPVFNVADIGVTVGALLLAASLWREEKKLEREEDVAAA